MSKSMAIEGVMKIFLMVAVIIVGMSFLLKAFGIDILGWLKEKFEGLGVPPDGKILHVRLDPTGPELWEFHLTDSPQHSSEGEAYFMLDEGSRIYQENCVIASTDEEFQLRGIFGDDKGYVFYVTPGTVIDANCGNNLKECVRDKFFIKSEGCSEGITKFIGNPEKEVCSPGGRCNLCIGGDLTLNPNSRQLICQRPNQGDTLPEDVNCGGDYNYIGCKNYQFFYNDINCDRPTAEGGNGLLVEKINFQNDIKVADDGCKQHPNNCNILVSRAKDDYDYKILNGLICDDNNRWKVCKKSDTPIKATVKGTTIECVPGDFYTWKEE